MPAFAGAATVRPNLQPPKGAELVGQHTDGSPIYRERRPNFVKRVKKDPSTGKDLWKRGPNGEPIKPKYELVQDPDDPWIVEDYVLEGARNGMTRKNKNFQASPEERKRVERMGARKRALDTLLDVMVDHDLTPEELVANALRARQEMGAPSPVEDTEAAPPEEPLFPVHKGFGRWLLSDGSIIQVSKEEAQLAEAELQDPASRPMPGEL